MQRIRLRPPGQFVLGLALLVSLAYVACAHDKERIEAERALLMKQKASVEKCFKEKGVPLSSLEHIICLDPCNVKWVE